MSLASIHQMVANGLEIVNKNDMQEKIVAEIQVVVTAIGTATTKNLVALLIPQDEVREKPRTLRLKPTGETLLGLKGVPVGNYILEVTAFQASKHVRKITVEPHRVNYEEVVLGDDACRYYKVAGRKYPVVKQNLIALRFRPTSHDTSLEKLIRNFKLSEVKLTQRLEDQGIVAYALPHGLSPSEHEKILKKIDKLADTKDVGIVLEHEGERLVWLSRMLLIEAEPDLHPKYLRELKKRYDVENIAALDGHSGYYLSEYKGVASWEILELAEKLESEPGIISVEVSTCTAGDLLVPNDYLYQMQWHLKRLQVEQAWASLAAHSAALEYGSPNVQIAIHDSGIQSLTEGGVTRPANFDFATPPPGALSKVSLFYAFDAQVHDNNGFGSTHGGMVAGIASANADKLSGSVGIAPHARLMGLRYNTTQTVMTAVFNWIAGLNPSFTVVFPGTPLINLPTLFDPAGPGGMGPDIINNSFKLAGGSPHPPLISAFRVALGNAGLYGRKGRGVCIFWPTGNFSVPTLYPSEVPMAAEPQVMAVAGSTMAHDGVTEIHAPQAGYGNGFGGSDRIEFCTPTDDRYTPSNQTNNITHNPPLTWGIVTTSTQYHGIMSSDENLPSRIGVSSATVTVAVAAGDSMMRVSTVSGFALTQQLVVGAYGSPGYEVVQSSFQLGIEVAHDKVVLGATLTFANAHPVGTLVQGLGFANQVPGAIPGNPSSIVLSNATGFLAGQWVVIGTPGAALSEAKQIDSVAGNTLNFLTPLANVYPAGPVPVQMLGGTLDTTLAVAAVAGNSTITVPTVYGFTTGHAILIGPPNGSFTTEARKITSVSAGNQLTLDRPLDDNHAIGTTIRGSWPSNTDNGGGTSASSPQAAGIAALLLAVNQQFSWVEVRDFMRRSADVIEISRTGTGQWTDKAGSAIVNGSGNLIIVGHVTTMSAAAAVAATTISVVAVGTYVQGQAIQLGAGANREICIIMQVNVGSLDVTPLKFAHAAGDDVKGGRIPYYSRYFGFGRLNAHRAVDLAIAYDHSHRDLILRDYLDPNLDQDDGLSVTNVALHPIHSPDIFVRNQPDPVASLGLNYQLHGPHQAPSNGILSVTYTHAVSNQNDLIAKGFYNGTTNRTFKVEIRTTGPETFRWKRSGSGWTTAPVVAGDISLSDGIVIRFGATTGHAAGDKWEIDVTGESFYIYTRIKNIGDGGPNPNALLSSLDCWVRSFVALSDGSIPPAPYVGGPVITTPFLFPRDWTTSNGISTIGTNTGANTTYYVNETLVTEGTIAAGADHTVRITWSRANLPPVANTLAQFLLSYAAPVDGALEGYGAESANNLSYREFAFTTLEIRAQDGVGMLPSFINVPGAGGTVTTAFMTHFRRYFGNMVEAQMEVYITRNPASGPVEEARYYYDGFSWILDDGSGGTPTWATMSSPVVGGTTTPAVGPQTDVSFSGTFDLNIDYTFLQVRLRVYSALHPENVLAETTQQVTVSQVGLPTGFAPTPPALYPRSFVFADMASLTQSTGKGFGPVSTDVFRITSSFTAAANTHVYAVVDGTVFVQEGANANVVNVVLRPLTQGINGFTPVKYIVYRGLLRSGFIDTGNPSMVTPYNASTNSEWIEWLYGVHQDLNGTVPFESKALGFDPANQPSSSALDKYFFNPDPDYQLPPAWKGVQLGQFSTVADEAGIEFVLEEGFFQPDLAYVRAGSYEVDVTGMSGTFAGKALREQILNFLDPAAYYGLHVRKHGYVQHVVSGNVVKIPPADIYDDVLAPFLSKNTLYLDVRNEAGGSYNFFGHHPTSGSGNNVEIGISSGSLTAQTYQTSDWPLLIRSNTGSPTVTPEDYNEAYLKMLTDYVTKPILYIEHGDLLDTSVLQREHFVEGDSLFVTGNTFTEELGFSHPNVLMPGGGPDDKLNVAWTIKVHLGIQEDGPVAWTGIPGALPTENMYDNLYGPLDGVDFWETGTDHVRWTATQARKYIDGTLRNFGYTSDRGVVYEGDVDANLNPGRVLFFANAVNAFKSAEEVSRSKGMNGGFTKLPSFFQELLVMKKLNLNFGVIDDGGNDVTSLQLAAVDTTSPQPESILFVGLDKSEYQTLKGLMAGFSADYPTALKLELVNATVDFRKYKVGLQGYDNSGAALSTFPTTDVHVYSTDDTLCFSDAFSQAEPLPTTYTRTFEEGRGVLNKRAVMNASIKAIVGGNKVELDGNWVDKISPKDTVTIAGASISGNNGGPHAIVSRSYDVATNRTTVQLVAALTNTSTPDGTFKLPERNLEDHFVDFDNFSTLSGIPEMVTLIADFQTALNGILDDSNAVPALEAAIDDKPALALQRARIMANQGGYANADDRILYWTRIKMIVALKSHPAMLRRTGTQPYLDLVGRFERKTRGFDTIDFSAAPVGTKKVLICGFDLYGVEDSPYRNNPSAGISLALHGQVLQDNSSNDVVYIQSVLFPNRYADFDGKNGIGVVETAFKKCIDTGDPNHTAALLPDMVVTVSQALAGDFWIDRFACRVRSEYPDNNQRGSSVGHTGSVPFPSLPSGAEFYETKFDPTKFKRTSNTGFPPGDLNSRTTIDKDEFCLFYNNVFNYKDTSTGTSSYYNESSFSEVVRVGQGFDLLPDGTAKVETTSDPNLVGLVPIAANLTATIKSVYGSGGHFLSNESFYRTARLREDYNPSLPTGHLHVPILMSNSGGESRGYPVPAHLNLESLQHLIERAAEIIVDGNRP